MTNPTPRGLLMNFDAFKSFKVPILDKGRGKGKGKGKASDKQEVSDVLAATDKDPADLGKFLSAVNWTKQRFQEEYNPLFGLLERTSFTCEHRLLAHRSTCLVTMTGLQWNSKSQNRNRDWPLLATAIVVESALVESYRGGLIDMCPGARSLRKALYNLFFGLTARHTNMVEGKARTVSTWEFADGVSSKDSDSEWEPEPYIMKDLMKQWQAAHAAFVKDRKDPILSFVQNLEKNKLLACSDPQAPSGTIETLAHHLITGLAEVSVNPHHSLHAFTPSADHV